MESISLSVILMFVISIIIQIVGQALWPKTEGFTKLFPTLISCALQVVGLVLFARVLVSGVQLSMLVPFAGATFPLVLIFIGIFIYKEKASILKIATLFAACILIGVANFL
jgi:quaternary ammonium compound-resistance protein SugE